MTLKKTILAAALIAAFAVAPGWTNSALDDLMERATTGDVAAQRELGQAYLAGTNVKRDEAQGVSWLVQAAEHGDAEAAYQLGIHYGRVATSGGKVNLAHRQKQAQYLRQATIAGHAPATRMMAELLLDRAMEENVPPEKRAKALQDGEALLRHAADNGHVAAMLSLADRLERGRGVVKNADEAVTYLERAARAGDAKTQYRLYQMFSDESHPKHSHTRARVWLKRAADARHAPAVLAYANLVLEGELVPRNLTAAADYIGRAESLGMPEAGALRTRLNQLQAADRPAPVAAAAAPTIAPTARPVTPPAPVAVKPASPVTESSPEPSFDLGADASLLEDPVFAKFSGQIAAMETRLEALVAQTESLKAELATRDARIVQLEAERDAAIERTAQSERAIASINSALQDSGLAPVQGHQPMKFAKAYQAPVKPLPKPVTSGGEADYAEGVVLLRARRYADARAHFERAAKQNHSGAQNNLGLMLVRGLGGKADPDAGIALLVQASNAGSSGAAESLGAIYDYGIGVAVDRDLAIEYYQLATKRGSSKARAGLARLGVNATVLSSL